MTSQNPISPRTEVAPIFSSFYRKLGIPLLPSLSRSIQPQQRTIVVDSVKRDYLIYLPPYLDKATKLPLLLAFHGGMTTPQRFAATTDLHQYAAQNKAIVVYPAGINRRWNDGSGLVNNDVDDIKFVQYLLTDLALHLPVDQRRIYATGVSNGGFFVQFLACTIPERFAAFSTVASTLSQVQADNCKRGDPTSFLMFNGTNDRFIPWQGGQQLLGSKRSLFSVLQTYRFWSSLHGCIGVKSTAIKSSKLSRFDRTRVNHLTSTSCSPKTSVQLYEIVGGGHTWPGGFDQPILLVGPTSRVINATHIIWTFFSQFSKPL